MNELTGFSWMKVEFNGGSGPSGSIRMADFVTSVVYVNLSSKILHHEVCQVAQKCGKIRFEL